VTYLVLDNITQGIENTPRSIAVSDDLLGDVRAALAELPVTVRQLLSENLVGIYFVQDLGGTAYTDYVAGDSVRLAAGFVILDMDVLGTRIANEWATWKESSPFIQCTDLKQRLNVMEAIPEGTPFSTSCFTSLGMFCR
jgi:hypothetical protein